MGANSSKPSSSSPKNKLLVTLNDGSTKKIPLRGVLSHLALNDISKDNIISVVVPSCVTEIPVFAFSGCTSLSSVEIPGSVTEIGVSAFYGCTSLASVVIPDGVTTIGESAFHGCTSLASVEIPVGVREIAAHAFGGCSSLSSVEIPDSVTEIGIGTFYGCTSLASVVIPDGVTTIGESAFHGLPADAVIICNDPERIAGNWLPADCLVVNDQGEALRHPEKLVDIPRAFGRWPVSYKVLYLRCRHLCDEAKRAVLEDDGVLLEGVREIFPDTYKVIMESFCDGGSLQAYEIRFLDALSIRDLKSLHEYFVQSSGERAGESNGPPAAPAKEQEWKMISGFMGNLLMPPKDASGEAADLKEAKGGPGPRRGSTGGGC